MHNTRESLTALDSRRMFFLAAFLVSVCLTPMLGEKPPAAASPKYDLETETKMKGTVDEVKLPQKGSEKEVAHLLIKHGSDILDVYLCPKSFLDDMGMSFNKGDDIALTGSKVKQNGTDLILAREVVKGDMTLALRDGKGEPVWSWHH
jgi:hypothetical protein